ncbi:MAG: translation initiation factor IF-3 [Actinomycetota bacterium]|nr:translation initiation factor IF-3 [Actinomycetota bacterium]
MIDPDGQQLGIKALPEAQSIARSMELDLVEVAPDANPPVCRIMNFTKFKYEEQQRAKESRKKATNIVVKEMKYRPKIGGGDFDTKTRKVAQFLGEGHKVKITIMFRGREMQHPELGRRILDRVAEEVAEVGKVEIMPKQDGRNMTMVLGPDKKAQALATAQAKKASEEESAPSASDATPSESPAPEATAPEATAPAPAPEPEATAAPEPAAAPEPEQATAPAEAAAPATEA